MTQSHQKIKCVMIILFFVAPFLNAKMSATDIANSGENHPRGSLNPDYTLSEPYAYYQKCGDYASLKIKVQSPSNSYPTEVVATVNGTNHTMFLKFIAEDEIFYRNNIMAGVYYFGYVYSPEIGTYQVQFTAYDGNFGWVTYGTNASFTKTAPTQYHDIMFTNEDQIFNNFYRFSVVFSKHYVCPYDVWVRIDNQNHSMEFEIESNRWVYEHDFGIDDENMHYWNYTVYTPSINNYLITGTESMLLSKVERIPYIDYSEYYFETSTASPHLVIFTYYMNWENIGPAGFKVEVNGINYTQSTDPLFNKYYGTVLMEYETLDWRKGAFLPEVNIPVVNDTVYDITLWAQNSSGHWISNDIISSELFRYYGQNAFALTVINNTIYKSGSYTNHNITIDIQTNLPIIGPMIWAHEHHAYITYPMGVGLSAVDPADVDFTDGKEYKCISILTNQNFWGNIRFYIEVTYMIGGENYYWRSEIFESSWNTGSIGEYGVSAKDILSYNFTMNNIECFCPRGVIKERDVSIVNIGRIQASDYVDYFVEDYPLGAQKVSINDYLDYCKINQRIDSEYNPFIEPGLTRKFIEPSDPQSFMDFQYFIPKNTVDDLYSYLVQYTNVPGVFTTVNNKISATQISGGYSSHLELEYDNNYRLIGKQFNVSIGSCYYRSKALSTYIPTEEEQPFNELDPSKGLDPLILAVIIIGLVMVGVLLWQLQSRKKKTKTQTRKLKGKNTKT